MEFSHCILYEIDTNAEKIAIDQCFITNSFSTMNKATVYHVKKCG